MELQEFIKNSLVQITNGVIAAQKELKDSGCLINPMSYSASSGSKVIYKDVQNNARMIQVVKMNVVLDVSKSSKAKSGIESDETTSKKDVTSMEFEIPISFPIMNP